MDDTRMNPTTEPPKEVPAPTRPAPRMQSVSPPPESPAAGAWWLLLGVALPGIALALVLWQTLLPWLSGDNPQLTAILASECVLTAAAAGCAIRFLLRKERLPGPFWAGVSGIYCVWLLFAAWQLLDDMDLYDGDLLLISCSLAMFPILISLLRVMLWLTPPQRSHSVGRPLLSLLVLPVLYYIAFVISDYAYGAAWTAILLVLAVVCTYGFVLLLVRTLFLLMRPQSKALPALRVVIVFVLPLLGLLISQMEPFSYAFWDFSSPVYYALVILNGILLLLPEPRGALRLPLHLARGATFLFVIYFFICLSPFYALSLLGILAFGAGLLVLSPLFLLFYQGRLLADSFRRLRADYGRLTPALVFLLGMLVIPACLVFSFSGDRENINTAMTYIDGSAQEQSTRVNIPALDRSLNYMTQGSHNGRTPPPLLAGLYSRTVIGSRVLSNAAYQRANILFFNADDSTELERSLTSARTEGTPTVVIGDIEVESVRDGDDYRSTVHFTLENIGTSDLGEYATSFMLPDGVYISGYYLDVLDERKQGLLTVREAATWIYNHIVSQARDPGILFYDQGEIVFRVFPFSQGETRLSGIEFLHRESAELEIAGHSILLAPAAPPLEQPVASGGAVYVSAAVKQTLEPANRKPYYLFVADRSAGTNAAGLAERILQFCEEQAIAPENASVMALNYRGAVWPMTGQWESPLSQFPAEGGFGLHYVIERLYGEYTTESHFPIIVVVSDRTGALLASDDAARFTGLCPEMDGFWQLTGDGLLLHPFDGGSPVAAKTDLGRHPVLVAEVDGAQVFLRNDGLPQVVASQPLLTRSQLASAWPDHSTWATALRLEGEHNLLAASGQDTESARLALIQQSFRTGIMTPLTSYIVLETPEQEADLLAKQKQILEGMTAPASGEAVLMSEPPMLLCLALALAVLLWRRRARQAAR